MLETVLKIKYPVSQDKAVMAEVRKFNAVLQEKFGITVKGDNVITRKPE